MLPFSASILVAAPLSGFLAAKANVSHKMLAQVGLAIALVGAVLVRQELQVTSTAKTLIPGLLFFGFGFGLALSQLANTTLSAVSVDQAGEASGVNNTFRQIGTSLGQALIGAVLISTLVARLHSDVQQSAVLPPAAKAPIASAMAVSIKSLGADNGNPKALAALPAPAQREILRIRNDTIVRGARAGMLATVGASLLAFCLTFALPNRDKLRAEDLDTATHS